MTQEYLVSYLDIASAAKQLGVSTKTVRRAIKSGALKAGRLSPAGAYRIPRSELDIYMNIESTNIQSRKSNKNYKTTEGAFDMRRHTVMPTRNQPTPHGDVQITSRWKRDRYYLVASGSLSAVRWMFPEREGLPEKNGSNYRYYFTPAGNPVTVERELRRKCAELQMKWDDWLEIGVVPDEKHEPFIETLGQLIDYLYEERKGYLAASTISRDRYKLKLWRKELGEFTLLADIDDKVLRKVLTEQFKTKKAATLNPALSLLKTYLNWAVENGYLTNVSYRKVKPLKCPSMQSSPKRWWTADEVAFAIRCAEKDYHQPTATLLVACGCYLGLRVEEVVMLRWKDLNLQPNRGFPVCSLTAHSGWKPKDGENRNIPIPDELIKILLRHERSDEYLLNPEESKRDRPRNRKGWVYRYDPRKTWQRIIKSIKSEGGREISMCEMRHSYASNLITAGVSDVKIARWMGHADTSMIHKHYGHLLCYDPDINAITRGKSNL